MKLKELVETNCKIAALDIDVRDHGRLIESYHIGTLEQEDRFANLEHGIQPRWKLINKELNIKREGNQYFGVKLKVIPKYLLDLDVTSWSCRDDYKYSTNNGLYRFDRLYVHVEGEDKCIESIAIEETNELEDNQMNIYEWLEEK